MKKLRVAIIGQGRSGRDIHGAYMRSAANTHFEVAAVAELLPERRERAAAEYNCDVYDDYRKILARDDIDLVVNSTYSHLHAPVTLDCLRAGKNTLVEKPFAQTAAQCDELINAAEANKLTLAVFQQSRLAPYYVGIKKLLATGIMGGMIQITIRYCAFARRWDWQTLQVYGGGSLYNTGPHPLDQALDLLALPEDVMPEVTSVLRCVNTSGDAEDYVKLIMTSPGKPLVDLEISASDAYTRFTYNIQCENGSILCTPGKMNYKYCMKANEAVRSVIKTPITNDAGLPAYCSENMTWYENEVNFNSTGAFNDAVSAYYEMLYKKLAEGVPMTIQPSQSRKQIAIMEKIHADNPLPVLYSL